MDIVDAIILLGFISIIIRYIMDIRELIIPIKRRKTEIIGLSIGTMVILWLMYKYAGLISHYIIGILGIIILILSVFRLGMTSNGFKVNKKGVLTWNWDKISSVHIIIKNDIKIEFYRKGTSDIHVYKKEDYDRIMEILRENLSNEKIRVQGN